MQNFHSELQGLEIAPFQTGEVVPMNLQNQDLRFFGGFRCGGFRCGGFRCGGFRCGFGCFGCGGFGGCFGCFGCFSCFGGFFI
ncbi:heterocycloanthracin/sonorensin family bacteriocin [Schinkia sp. CFF1]